DDRTTVEHGARISDRHGVVLPVRGQGLDPGNHLRGRERRARGQLAMRGLARGQHLHVSTADVDDQHPHPKAQLALAKVALFAAMTLMSSFQEATNAFAPSSWSWLARASTSTPARANRASTSSESPPSVGSISPRSPWSASAFNVPSGMVFTVKGAARERI